MVLVIDHLGRLVRVVSGIVPMRRRGDRPEDGSDDHAGHRAGMVPAIMAVAHPEDHGRQDRQDHQARPGMG
jgi:hypothetical protein